MRKVLKWIAIIIGSLLALAVLALAGIYTITENRMNKVYELQVQAIQIPTDQESIERGKHLIATMGLCTECHGENFAGQSSDDGPLVGRLSMPNLTSGKGGIGGEFSDIDWIRAIRHGVGPDGKSLKVMPSNLYNNLSDTDLGAIIAYIKQVPPVDHELPKTTIGPMARVFVLLDPSLLPAELIDHEAPRPTEIEPGITIAYGKYLATVCTVCHGQNLAGEEGAGGGLNLTPGGDLAHWTKEDFFKAVRTGVTPRGKTLDPTMMPWKNVGQFNDEELEAIWLYLQSVPAVETPEQNSQEGSQ